MVEVKNEGIEKSFSFAETAMPIWGPYSVSTTSSPMEGTNNMDGS